MKPAKPVSAYRSFLVWPFAGAFAGFILHSFASQIGWSSAMGQPWLSWSLALAGAGALYAGVVTALARRREMDREARAAELGFKVRVAPEHDVRAKFTRWLSGTNTRLEHVIVRETGDVFLGIADVGAKEHVGTMLVCEDPAMKLPAIRVFPRTLLRRILVKLAGFDALQLNDASEFGRRFLVTTDQESRACSLLTRSVIDRILQQPKTELRGRGDGFALLVPSAGSDLRAWIGLAEHLREQFCDQETVADTRCGVAPSGSDAPERLLRRVRAVGSLAGRACLAMAVLLFGVAAWFAVDHAWFRWQSRKVAGEVVELEGSGPFRAIVRYTVEGKTHTVTSTVASYPPAHAVGEEVDVIYDPKDPANARLGSLWEACFFTLVFGLVGAAFLLGSALFRREQRNIDWEVRRRDRRRRGLGSFLSRRRRTRRREGGGR